MRCRKLPNGESVYAPLERDDHHLTCVSCGLSKVLLQGFKPLFHTFEIHGLCRGGSACERRMFGDD